MPTILSLANWLVVYLFIPLPAVLLIAVLCRDRRLLIGSLVAAGVFLIIWGADGTVLISDHAGATTWSGAVPSKQDYFISVRAVGGAAATYTLKVTIPPK